MNYKPDNEYIYTHTHIYIFVFFLVQRFLCPFRADTCCQLLAPIIRCTWPPERYEKRRYSRGEEGRDTWTEASVYNEGREGGRERERIIERNFLASLLWSGFTPRSFPLSFLPFLPPSRPAANLIAATR